MSTLHGMNGRLARAEKKAPKPPEKRETKELDLTPFTDEEVEHIHMVWAIIENDFHRLYRLTDEQFEYVKLVIHMDEVDQAGEQASLDENLISDYEEIKEWWKHRDELPPDYPLRRAWYRQRKAHIEREMARCHAWRGDRLYFNSPTYEAEMRAWVDAYGDASCQP